MIFQRQLSGFSDPVQKGCVATVHDNFSHLKIAEVRS
jgi:hypothetical protein